jgi:hypothetical protein
MQTFVNELQSATDFVIQLFAEQGVELDYSIPSIQHLDELFGKEFINGRLINGASVFAEYQGLIMTGISGYIAKVILQNTQNAQLSFEENDEHWFINFTIEAENGQKLMPGHRVLKRAYNGDDDLLYPYVIEAINYFNRPAPFQHFKTSFSQLLHQEEATGKQWWKIW